jgi:ELWxxDGT repeat protein
VREIVPPDDFQTNPYIAPTLGRGGDRLFFTAFDHQIGLELYVVTANGSTLLKDVFPGNTFSPSPQNFTDANGMLLFTADDGVHGSELWVSDGTAAGTRRVTDPAPPRNPRFAVPSHGTTVSDRVAFSERRAADFLTSEDEPLAFD